MISTSSISAVILLRERDAVQRRMLAECEELLSHDEATNVLKLKLRRAEDYRQTIKARLAHLSADSQALEGSYRQLTGQAMPLPPKAER